MDKKYLIKAKKILDSGFFMSGYGHFMITIEEFALILEMFEKNDFKGIKSLYKKLEKERL